MQDAFQEAFFGITAKDFNIKKYIENETLSQVVKKLEDIDLEKVVEIDDMKIKLELKR
jgi:hypothetical protein